MAKARNVVKEKTMVGACGDEKHFKIVMAGLFLVVAGLAFKMGLGLAEVLILIGVLLMAKGALISADRKLKY
ncbi:MAG: hypothetical protein WA139_02175 [Candidatus Aenigmatarchaeota archaeon]